MTEIKLKPCPFCGAEAITQVAVIRSEIESCTADISFIVSCSNCYIGQRWDINDRDSFEDAKTAMQKAIEAWNRRIENETELMG